MNYNIRMRRASEEIQYINREKLEKNQKANRKTLTNGRNRKARDHFKNLNRNMTQRLNTRTDTEGRTRGGLRGHEM